MSSNSSSDDDDEEEEGSNFSSKKEEEEEEEEVHKKLRDKDTKKKKKKKEEKEGSTNSRKNQVETADDDDDDDDSKKKKKRKKGKKEKKEEKNKMKNKTKDDSNKKRKRKKQNDDEEEEEDDDDDDVVVRDEEDKKEEDKKSTRKKEKKKKKKKSKRQEDEAENDDDHDHGDDEKDVDNNIIKKSKEKKSTTIDEVKAWRKENKIVLLSSSSSSLSQSPISTSGSKDEDVTTRKSTVMDIRIDSSYFPFITFDDMIQRTTTATKTTTNGRGDSGDAVLLLETSKALNKLIRHCIDQCQFKKPSPIQAQAWPILLLTGAGAGAGGSASGQQRVQQHRDVVGIAETGSGKTLAFALPALAAIAGEAASAVSSSSSSSGQRNNRNNNNKNGRYQRGGGHHPRRRLPSMLILSPTRELAMQSDRVIQEFGSIIDVTSLVVYGGVPKYTQTSRLQGGRNSTSDIDIIVATPGRLVDLVKNDGVCDLSNIQYLVLDEADRMLDMGFEEDVKYIISQCKPSTTTSHNHGGNDGGGRRTCMFSATWPSSIQRIANEYMINPIRVYVGFESSVSVVVGTGTNYTSDSKSHNNKNGILEGNKQNNNDNDDTDNNNDSMVMMVDDSLSANKRVEQIVEVIDDREREARLKQILRQRQQKQPKHDNTNNNNNIVDRILIFALYKKEAERLERIIQQKFGYYDSCCSIHGNKNQSLRTTALEQFRSGQCSILVATDVASRGLDIPNVNLVINYTFPLTIEDYVHRIGRTGRAGKTGTSVTFFQPTVDKSHAGELQLVMKQANQTIPPALLKFDSTIKRKEHSLYGNFGPKNTNGPPITKKPTKIKFD